MTKLIMIMIDGVSAKHFAQHRKYLPNLDLLAQQGLQVTQGVTPEMAGVSMPGRTSIITGTPPAEHGIYANRIYDRQAGLFRWAHGYDVRCKTLPQLAKEQGLRIANIGYGMPRPEDCHVYMGPWWADDMLLRARDNAPCRADQYWLKAGATYDPDNQLGDLFANHTVQPPVRPNKAKDVSERLQLGLLADNQMLEIGAALACSKKPPDLLLMELGMPDYYMHKYGQFSDYADFSLRHADAMIGVLRERLRQANKLHEYHLMILSDHGHCALNQGVYINNILDPSTQWSGEGSVLHVVRKDAQHEHEVTNILAHHSIERWHDTHIPEDMRSTLMTFVAPQDSDMSFENSPQGYTDITGPSKYRSNHGLRPGRTEDFRFCICHGSSISPQTVDRALTIQVAPTMAKILGITTPWQAPALL
ncbi:MAG: alkaline phosphatase family protein [Gammaproteobacteria bacterium]|nr:alkaline phosphatase family protein [Gammaproteobacteria bacterium]